MATAIAAAVRMDRDTRNVLSSPSSTPSCLSVTEETRRSTKALREGRAAVSAAKISALARSNAHMRGLADWILQHTTTWLSSTYFPRALTHIEHAALFGHFSVVLDLPTDHDFLPDNEHELQKRVFLGLLDNKSPKATHVVDTIPYDRIDEWMDNLPEEHYPLSKGDVRSLIRCTVWRFFESRGYRVFDCEKLVVDGEGDRRTTTVECIEVEWLPTNTNDADTAADADADASV